MTEGGRTVLILFVTAAAASDLRWGRIYNFLTLPTLAAGLLLLMMNTPEELPPMLGVIAEISNSSWHWLLLWGRDGFSLVLFFLF